MWFFALFTTQPDLLYLGTCASLPHTLLPHDPRTEVPDLDFSLHSFLPPCVPILPDLWEVPSLVGGEALCDHATLTFTSMFDGVLIVNPSTLFAIRLCEPEILFLYPLLQRRQSVPEFLAVQMVQTNLTDTSRLHVDRHSHRWWKECIQEMTDRLFGEPYGDVLARLQWHVQSVHQWIGPWMGFVSSLCWEDWQQLELDLQRPGRLQAVGPSAAVRSPGLRVRRGRGVLAPRPPKPEVRRLGGQGGRVHHGAVRSDPAIRRRGLTQKAQGKKRKREMATQFTTVTDELSWLPRTTDFTPLAALSTCYMNTDAGCDILLLQKQEIYHNAWRYPAPDHCKPTRRRGEQEAQDPVIHSDRIGVVTSRALCGK